MIIRPSLTGIDARHSKEFQIDRPCDPFGSSLILGFRSGAVILTADGMEEAVAGDCIIHTPDFPQYHACQPGADEGYRNDWLHVAPEPFLAMVERLELPVNRLIHTGKPEILSVFIRNIQRELQSADRFSDAFLLSHLQGMLLTIARTGYTYRQLTASLSRAEIRYYWKFRELRAGVLENYAARFDIKSLARRTGLSQERFSALYRKFFSASPYSEILDARIIHAKSLLVSSSLDINEIARACGWSDIHYFSRVFKKKTTVSPSVYRAQYNTQRS